MNLREITIKEEWNIFLSECLEKTFLQSWNWGDFNESMGTKIWRFGIYQEDRLIAVSLVLKISAKRGTFLFIPHGPAMAGSISHKDKKEILALLLIHLGDIAKKEKASFIRFAPITKRTQENENIFADLGFRQAPTHMHPEVTWELDITLPEEQLLMNMRKTTRYLIRKAQKDPDIEIIRSDNIEDLNLFWPVYKETSKRNKFVIFSKEYLQAEFKSFSKDREILIFLAKYKGEVISTAIFVIWKDICFYHHAGSLTKFRKIPASYLLQFEAIKEAKIRGCRSYNFWGIAPGVETKRDAQKSSHPWAGLSLFKMGFGGYKKEYTKTKDFIISNKYWINYIVEKIRKRKRNL